MKYITQRSARYMYLRMACRGCEFYSQCPEINVRICIAPSYRIRSCGRVLFAFKKQTLLLHILRLLGIIDKKSP